MTEGSVPAPELPWHRRTFEILKAAAQEFGNDKIGRLGAALSFYTLFSLVPLLFLATAVAGILLGSESELQRVVDQVRQVAGDDVARVIEDILQDVVAGAGTSLLIGIPLAAFTASGILLQAQGALNQIFHVPEEEHEGIVATIVATVVKRLVAVVAAVFLAIMVLTPIVAVAGVNWLADLVTGVAPRWVGAALRLGVPLVSLAMLLVVTGLTFQFLTGERIPWEAARKGGVFTALLGLLAAYVVGFFLGLNRGGDGGQGPPNALGVLGGVALLLVFFNLLWQVYLFGAEVTKVYIDYLENGDILPPSERAERRRSAAVEGSERQVERASPVKRRLEESRGLGRTGVFAFLAGLAIGWMRRPRP